jgi:hypothetical protein
MACLLSPWVITSMLHVVASIARTEDDGFVQKKMATFGRFYLWVPCVEVGFVHQEHGAAGCPSRRRTAPGHISVKKLHLPALEYPRR